MTDHSCKSLFDLYIRAGEHLIAIGQKKRAADAFALALYYATELTNPQAQQYCRQRIVHCDSGHPAAQMPPPPLVFAQLLMSFPAEVAEKSMTEIHTAATPNPTVDTVDDMKQWRSMGVFVVEDQWPPAAAVPSSVTAPSVAAPIVAPSVATPAVAAPIAEVPKVVEATLSKPAKPKAAKLQPAVSSVAPVKTSPPPKFEPSPSVFDLEMGNPFAEELSTVSAFSPPQAVKAAPLQSKKVSPAPLAAVEPKATEVFAPTPVAMVEPKMPEVFTPTPPAPPPAPSKVETTTKPVSQPNVAQAADIFDSHHVYDLGTGPVGLSAGSMRAVEDLLLSGPQHSADPFAEPRDPPFAGLLNLAASLAAVVGFASVGFFGYTLYPQLKQFDIHQFVDTMTKGKDGQSRATEALELPEIVIRDVEPPAIMEAKVGQPSGASSATTKWLGEERPAVYIAPDGKK